MKAITKHYTKGDVTIVWKPEQCIHSTVCWKGLKEVFNPNKHPWIDMDGADIEQIKEQVSHCPSGALSYIEDNKEVTADNIQTEVVTSVEVMKNGPLMIYGNITVKDNKVNILHKNKVTAFCRCGASSNKPFCDGTHIKIGFRDE